MQNTDQGVITLLEKLPSSFTGNPQYRVTLDNGNSYQTAPNSMVAFDIESKEYRSVTVQLSLNNKFRVFNIQVV